MKPRGKTAATRKDPCDSRNPCVTPLWRRPATPSSSRLGLARIAQGRNRTGRRIQPLGVSRNLLEATRRSIPLEQRFKFIYRESSERRADPRLEQFDLLSSAQKMKLPAAEPRGICKSRYPSRAGTCPLQCDEELLHPPLRKKSCDRSGLGSSPPQRGGVFA
jgi:hypothetical protein